MKADLIFKFLNSRSTKVSLLAPSGTGKTTAARKFAVLAAQSHMRVVVVHDEDSQVTTAMRYFHLEITGKENKSDTAYDLRTGGTVRAITFDDFMTTCLPVPDVLIIDMDHITVPQMYDIDSFDFRKKLIVLATNTEGYLGLITDKYHIIHPEVKPMKEEPPPGRSWSTPFQSL